jgi:hypothetical protein
MFSTIGIFAITFLDSRCGFIGKVIVESIVAIGASPRVSAAPLIRILGVVAREWRRLPGFEATAFASGWFRLAHRASYAIASVVGIFSCSLGGVREALQSPAAALARVWSETSIIGRRLAVGGLRGIGSVGCPFGARECYGG